MNKPAIALKPLLPDEEWSREAFFGGNPTLPTALEWPRGGDGRALHFLMQVACAALADADPDMPREGTLFFFGGCNYEGDEDAILGRPTGSRVIHWPAPLDDVPEREPPKDMAPLGEYSFLDPSLNRKGRRPSWLPARQRQPSRAFGRVSMDPVPFDSAPDRVEDGLITALPSEMDVREPYQYPVLRPPESVMARIWHEAETSDFRWNRSLTPHPGEDADARFLRPVQMLGCVPTVEEALALDRTGLMPGSPERVMAAFRMASARPHHDDEEVLLLQLPTAPPLSFRSPGDDTFRFTIRRADLRARAFDRAGATSDKLYTDGRWRAPTPAPPAPILPPEQVMPALLLKQMVPGETSATPLTYGGGCPTLPPSASWPLDAMGAPMTFILQVDFATLPRILHHGGAEFEYPTMPDEGGFLLFWPETQVETDEDEGGSDGFRVIHVTEALENVPPRTAPPGVQRLPYRLHEALAYASCKDVCDDEDAPTHEDMLRALFSGEDAVEGNAYVLPWLTNWYRRYGEKRITGKIGGTRGSDAPLVEIPETWPWRWADIQYPIDKYLENPSQYGSKKADAILWPSLREDAKKWQRRGANHAPSDRVACHDAEAFRSWLRSLDAAAERMNPEGGSGVTSNLRVDLDYAYDTTLLHFGHASPNRTMEHLDHGDTDDIPARVVEALAREMRHRRGSGNTNYNPQMFGEFYGRQWCRPDDELLLRLPYFGGKDVYATRLMIGWIDLAAGRVEMTQAVVDP